MSHETTKSDDQNAQCDATLAPQLMRCERAVAEDAMFA